MLLNSLAQIPSLPTAPPTERVDEWAVIVIMLTGSVLISGVLGGGLWFVKRLMASHEARDASNIKTLNAMHERHTTAYEKSNDRWATVADANTEAQATTAGLLGELGHTFKCYAKPGGE